MIIWLLRKMLCVTMWTGMYLCTIDRSVNDIVVWFGQSEIVLFTRILCRKFCRQTCSQCPTIILVSKKAFFNSKDYNIYQQEQVHLNIMRQSGTHVSHFVRLWHLIICQYEESEKMMEKFPKLKTESNFEIELREISFKAICLHSIYS